MAVNLFTFVRLFRQQLTVAQHLLDKGVEHAHALGADPEAMLDWRLIDDMQPLRFQLSVIATFAQTWPARVADAPLPAELPDALGLDATRRPLQASGAFLHSLTPDQFVGRDDTLITLQLGAGPEPTLPAGRWLSGFAATSLYFHLSIVYAILRARGVPLGKIDLFAAGL